MISTSSSGAAARSKRCLETKQHGHTRFIGFTGHKHPHIHLRVLELADNHGVHLDSVHDLRRTMIPLARTDGARKDILELCTHTPRKGSAIDLYTTFPWESLCEEVSKLKVQRRTDHGDVLPLRAVGLRRRFPTVFLPPIASRWIQKVK